MRQRDGLGGSTGVSRFREKYKSDVVPGLIKHFKYDNIMAVPRLEKTVLNMGLGEAVQNSKILDSAADELGRIAGQRPIITRAKKSVANFKLRENVAIGAAVTLRGEQMFEFLDRLINVALPRVRDFRGLPTKSFDGRGNYTLGLIDQLIFPEIDYAKVDKIKGMNVTIVTTARTDDEGRELLRLMGMPFQQPQ
jgi:large subunit ribosomal protein L5